MDILLTLFPVTAAVVRVYSRMMKSFGALPISLRQNSSNSAVGITSAVASRNLLFFDASETLSMQHHSFLSYAFLLLLFFPFLSSFTCFLSH